MKDRFDLENEISQTSVFAKHLRDLSHGILEEQLTTDEIANALEGLAVLGRFQYKKETYERPINLLRN